MTYDWLAAIAFVATFMLLMRGLRWVAWRLPAFAEMRDQNQHVDRSKMGRTSYRSAVKESTRCGLYTNLGFYILVLPFFVSFESRPLWQHAVETVAVVAIFDFMYYLMHRFVFHDGPLRKVHALHHQARKPTYMDAHYVHPLETFIGLVLFQISIPIVALIEGAPLNFFSAAIAMLIFSELNSLNHCWTKLSPKSRVFRTVDYITGVHHAHHIDMSHGNYATLTMFYDKLFGTFEEPVKREAA